MGAEEELEGLEEFWAPGAGVVPGSADVVAGMERWGAASSLTDMTGLTGWPRKVPVAVEL
jgi:hypothetical protein